MAYDLEVDELFTLGIIGSDEGVLRIDIPRVIEYLGYPVTEHNKDLAIQTLKEVLEEMK